VHRDDVEASAVTATPMTRESRSALPPNGLGPPHPAREPLTIGLVNNMPDSAFADTEAQFLRLLTGSRPASSFVIRRYSLSSLTRGPAVAPLLEPYTDVDRLYEHPPDALIITGTEPHFQNMRDEPYWQELEELLVWGETSVSSVLLSCLSAHAALLAIDGVRRTLLPSKCFGVFAQEVHHGNGLVRGVDSVAFAHSRLNEVPAEAMRSSGYDVLVESPHAGWTVATREREGALTVMFQGHPEYSRDTLLREYRRDLRRYVEGERPTMPAIPAGYLDGAGQSIAEQFGDRINNRATNGSSLDDFPFDLLVPHITADWSDASSRLVSNWLSYVERSRSLAGR
jgi:homoserine O-succinyltransferase/O-acetyltransferase